MTGTQPILADLAKLDATERAIVQRFIDRRSQAPDPEVPKDTFGARVADRVAKFGGSWPFIILATSVIASWVLINVWRTSFDPYPFILLNLVLSCVAALQAPVILMSQNRQSARDRLDAKYDYEVNLKAEMEIVSLHAKLDEIRERKWAELMELQQRQIEMLSKLADAPTSQRPSR